MAHVGNQISNLFKSDHGVAGLYVALIGGIVANAVPDPTDALSFYWDRQLRIKLETGQISVEHYWEKKAAIYYLMDAVWWAIILVVAILVKGDIRTKATVVGALIGGGLVVGIIFNNIEKDKEFFSKYKLVER